MNTSSTGEICLPWYWQNEAQPFMTSFIEANENYCRNPTLDPLGPYCFVDGERGITEYCDIPWCTGIIFYFKLFFILLLLLSRVCITVSPPSTFSFPDDICRMPALSTKFAIHTYMYTSSAIGPHQNPCIFN